MINQSRLDFFTIPTTFTYSRFYWRFIFVWFNYLIFVLIISFFLLHHGWRSSLIFFIFPTGTNTNRTRFSLPQANSFPIFTRQPSRLNWKCAFAQLFLMPQNSYTSLNKSVWSAPNREQSCSKIKLFRSTGTQMRETISYSLSASTVVEPAQGFCGSNWRLIYNTISTLRIIYFAVVTLRTRFDPWSKGLCKYSWWHHNNYTLKRNTT